MDKLCGTAKKLDIFFRILFYLLIALTVMAAVIMALAFSAESAGNFMFSMSGINVTFPDGSPALANGRFAVYFCLAMFAVAGVALYGIRIVRKILSPMKQGLPFSPSVSGDLSKLGILTLIGGALYTVFDLVGKNFLVSLIDMPEFTNVVVGIRHKIDGSFLVIAAILFLFSYIFRYGAALQQQADETL